MMAWITLYVKYKYDPYMVIRVRSFFEYIFESVSRTFDTLGADEETNVRCNMVHQPSSFDGMPTAEYHVCMCGHTYGKSMDQLGKVVNPARGQLNREN